MSAPAPARFELLEAVAKAVTACSAEYLRAILAGPDAPRCAGCGCVRFVGNRCALCGGQR